MKIFENIKLFFQNSPTMNMGDSMNYLGVEYRNSNIKCNINDEVIIHPTGKSKATKSYPGKVVTKQIKGQDGKAKGDICVLCVVGIKDNTWIGTWMNNYLFGRLEFVGRNYKEDLNELSRL